MRTLLTACRTRWKRRSPLFRDVSLVLALKVAALVALWALFFSAPIARHMLVAPDRVADRILSPQAMPPESADALR